MMRREEVLREEARQKDRLRGDVAQLEQETPRVDFQTRALLLLIRTILLTWGTGTGE